MAIADVDHDGFRDIILGPGGVGGGQVLLIINGRALFAQFKLTPNAISADVSPNPFASAPLALPALQYAPPYGFPNGIHVATADLDGDGFGDILLGGGPGNGTVVSPFLTNAGGTTTPGIPVQVFGGNLFGTFVAGAPV